MIGEPPSLYTLRNPLLTALRTNLELAARSSGTDPLMTGAMEQTARWERLNDDLVQLSRIEGGIGLENVGPVDLGRQLCRLGLLMRRPCLKGY